MAISKEEKLEQLLGKYGASVIDKGDTRYVLEVPESLSDEALIKLSCDLESLINLPTTEYRGNISYALNSLNSAIELALNSNSIATIQVVKMINSLIFELYSFRKNIPHVMPKVGSICNVNFGNHLAAEVSGRLACIVLATSAPYIVYVSPILKDGFKSVYYCDNIFHIQKSDIHNLGSHYLSWFSRDNKIEKIVYPINFYRITEFNIGNISETTLSSLLEFMGLKEPENCGLRKTEHSVSASSMTESKLPNTMRLMRERNLTNKELLRYKFKNAFKNLIENDNDIDDKVNAFLTDIGMEKHPSVVLAFKTVPKYYGTLLLTFARLFNVMGCHGTERLKIRNDLSNVFINWKKSYPELDERKSLSIIHLLRLFAEFVNSTD